MTIKEILLSGSGLLVILMTLIQFAPIKINPWSALAKAIGKAINADMSSRLSEIGAKYWEGDQCRYVQSAQRNRRKAGRAYQDG